MSTTTTSNEFYQAAKGKWIGRTFELPGQPLQTVATVSRAPLPMYDAKQSPDAFYTRTVLLNTSSGAVLYGCMHDSCYEVGSTAMGIARVHWREDHPEKAEKRSKPHSSSLATALGDLGSQSLLEVLERGVSDIKKDEVIASQVETILSLRDEVKFLRKQLDDKRTGKN